MRASTESRNRWQQAPKRTEEEPWLMAYGDMMTLLLVFFVLLVSIAQIDAVRLQVVTQSMRTALGAETSREPPLLEVEQRLKQFVRQNRLQGSLRVTRDERGVQLQLQGEAFFASADAKLLDSRKKLLVQIAAEIARTPYKVVIEGHSDSDPIQGTRFPSNWELSGARAAAVARFFEDRGLPRSRFAIAGLADTEPVDARLGNSTPEAKARNRRVVINFLAEYAD